MTSVHVLTAIDQNFLLSSRGEAFLLGNVKGRKFTEKKNNDKSNKAEEIQLANLAG